MRGEDTLMQAAVGFMLKASSRATKAGDTTARSRGFVARAIPIAGVVMRPSEPSTVTEAIQRLSAIQDPMSPERQGIRDSFSELAVESPEHAAALETYVQRSADYLLSRAPRGGIDLSVPFGSLEPPRYRRDEAESFARAVAAVQNPAAALQRIADGEYSQEDLDAIRELHPKAWQRFVTNVQSRLAELKEPPSYAARLRMSRTLGVPMTAFEKPSFQRLIASSAGVEQAAESQAKSSVRTAQLARGTGNMSAGSDRAIARGE
jgi:hypothetical protein